MPPEPTTFYSDSQAALRAISKPECKSYTVWECRQALRSLRRHRPVRLRWIKAHVGHKYNEEADKLAKKGTTSTNFVATHTPMRQIKTELRHRTIRTWMDRWAKDITCRQTRLIVPKPSKYLTDFLFDQHRTEFSSMVQFCTGHNFLKYHRYNTNRAPDATCRLCQEDRETAWHLLTECPALFWLRHQIFYTDQPKAPFNPTGIADFIAEARVAHLLHDPLSEEEE